MFCRIIKGLSTAEPPLYIGRYMDFVGEDPPAAAKSSSCFEEQVTTMYYMGVQSLEQVVREMCDHQMLL